MTELGEATVPIRATLDKLDKDLADAKSRISGVVDNLASVGNVAIKAGIAGVTAAVAGLGAALGFSLSQALANEQQQASLAAVIKSTGGVAGVTAEEANTLAQSFAHLTQGSDDAVLSIIEVGLRSAAIAEEDFPAFIQASIDLGQVMGDSAAAATLLARAQEDPVAAMGRLQRTGIIFSDTLKEQITQLAKTGDMAGATALIMDRVAEATAGAAEAAAGTTLGRWETLKGRLGEVAEGIGNNLIPFAERLFTGVLEPAIPIIENIATLIGTFFDRIGAGMTIGQALPALITEIGLAMGLSQEQAAGLGEKVSGLITWLTDLGAKVQEVVVAVQPYIEMAANWLANNVKLTDVLIALGVAIAAVVIPAIVSVVATAAPIIATFVAVIAIVALLRTAWENDWGGIQEKTAAVWAAVQPLLMAAKEWLEVNIPIALEALRTFWVETAWPAIQRAIEVVWPIIQDIFTQLKDFILVTLIPTVRDLYLKWTTEWWPSIQTTLENVWTVISGVFEELGRWVNTNIIPWVQELQRVWAEEVWPAIQKGLEDAWAVIKPIWEAFQLWMETNIPKALNTLQPIWEGVMTGLNDAIKPVKDLWDGLTKAVSDFWSWITSHTFSFDFHIPDLPSWALPGSPLPIHAAWQAFAAEMNRTTISPNFDMEALLPVASLIEDGGAGREVQFNSTTNITTSADPLRVLRAARHLDRLEALA